MYVMNEKEEAERLKAKVLHRRVRAAMRVAEKTGGQAHRYMLLAWGYIRGFKYRRMERQHHFSQGFEHHMPDATMLHRILGMYLPAGLEPQTVKDWVLDPSGAIPAPAPRPKKPYVAAQAAE